MKEGNGMQKFNKKEKTGQVSGSTIISGKINN